MPHLAPLNWVNIFMLANLQLILTFILVWWTYFPSYKIPLSPTTPSTYHLPF
uniref:ATP synthase F0 subunit 8 n=1 Tax=Phyllochaetopterus sp. AW-2015 TaxID=1750699 RepID=A0A0S2N0F1_9ANNE|nr:ATP synthase F0 subunit 8 [Phyllochaetopterus sp. AW-2015]